MPLWTKTANPLSTPNEVAALLPFGGHKGYGMALLNEIMAGQIISYPILDLTQRGRDLHAHLRLLEDTLNEAMSVIAEITAQRLPLPLPPMLHIPPK